MHVNYVIAGVKDYIPNDHDSLRFLEDKLGKLSDEERDNFFTKIIPQLELKKRWLVLTVHFFLGGVGYGRAMVGDWWRAVLYVLLFYTGNMLFFNLGYNPFLGMEADPAATAAVAEAGTEDAGGLVFLIWLIWWLFDFYFLAKKIRTKNLKKILDCL